MVGEKQPHVKLFLCDVGRASYASATKNRVTEQPTVTDWFPRAEERPARYFPKDDRRSTAPKSTPIPNENVFSRSGTLRLWSKPRSTTLVGLPPLLALH